MTGSVKAVAVIHQGSKFFWRTRNSIDVTIVDHKDLAITEIICYEPSIDVEGTRIYLDSTILNTKLDHAQIEEKLSFAKQNDVPHTEKFVRDLAHQASVDYITSRLFLTEFSVEPKKFSVQLQFNFRDRDLDVGDDSIDRLICDAPSGLVPWKVRHHKIFSADEKEAAVKALATERQTLQEHCNTAMALQTQTALPLGLKERWRIPIVLARLAQGRRLSGADNKIWAAVASNLKTQEDIDRVTSVTMRTLPTSAAMDVSPQTATKVASPGGRPPMLSRTATPHRSPCATPHRSPCITPNGSSRLLTGTVSSQNRANSAAEDAPRKTPRKLSKIGKKKSSIRRSKSRNLGAHSSSADTEPDDLEYSGSGMQAPEPVSFMGQLAAGLASLTSFKRNSTRKIYVSEEDEGVLHQFSFRGSMKADTTPATVRETQDSAEGVCEQRRALGSFQPHLLGTTSTMPSLRGEFAFLNAAEITPPLYTQHSLGIAGKGAGEGAGIADQSDAAAEAPTADTVHDEPTAPPRKRRSYFGALLASFSRADSSLSLGSMENNTGHPHTALRKQTSKRGGQMLFGDALAGWWPWSGPQVMPTNLPEYHPDVEAQCGVKGMIDPSGTVVVYQGSKFFWRTRNTVDVTIVNHTNSNTTEIICYEPTIDAEASRIYLDSSILRVKIDQEVEDAVANYAKQHNIVSHTDKFVRDVINKAAADYILNRLFLVQFSKELRSFVIQLQFNFRDRDLEYGGDSIDRMILSKPSETITAHQPQHHRIITAEEVEAAIHALEEEQRTFREACVAVEALQTQTDVQLGVKERWRIPIVMAKVAQNRRLSGADSLIWEAMARNLGADDDITKVAGVALRVVTAAPMAPTSSGASIDNVPAPAAVPTPLPTPMQSPTVTTTRLFSPKANPTQGRLYAATASSQMRADAIGETLAKPHKHRKFFKRGAHKTTAATPKAKRARAGKGHAHVAQDTGDNHEPHKSETEALEEKMGFEEEEETTFVGQLATTLATIASSISGKFASRNPTTRIHDRMRDASGGRPETDSAEASAHGSVNKNTSVSVTCRETDDPELTPKHSYHDTNHNNQASHGGQSTQHKSITSALNTANLMAGMSASASTSSKKDHHSQPHGYAAPGRLGDCPAPLTNQRSLFRIGSSGAGSAAGGTDRSDDPDGAAQETESPQRKRRSYFGSFLATFSRADSSASLDLSSPVQLNQNQNHSVLVKSPSKPGQSFAATLTRLMSWRHHDQVVPAS